LTSSLTSKNLKSPNHPKKIVLVFLGAKLFAYTLLGLLLGLIGSSLNISSKIQGIFQILIGLFMIATAGRLLDIHPIFRYFVITPPKFVLRQMRKLSISDSFLTPFILGVMTVLIPCGVTQAMMLYAIGASSPLWGAGIMFAFILGTSPVFFLIGLASGELFKKKAFNYIAATFIFVIGIISINSGQILRGSVHTLQNYYTALTRTEPVMSETQIENGVQQVTINVTNSGYKASTNTLRIGVPVKITLITNNVMGCARAFTIPDQNYFKILPATGTQTLEFTPEKLGNLTYTCSMGMFSGQFIIIN
jgi:sulfite exporter TauE/SafE